MLLIWCDAEQFIRRRNPKPRIHFSVLGRQVLRGQSLKENSTREHPRSVEFMDCCIKRLQGCRLDRRKSTQQNRLGSCCTRWRATAGMRDARLAKRPHILIQSELGGSMLTVSVPHIAPYAYSDSAGTRTLGLDSAAALPPFAASPRCFSLTATPTSIHVSMSLGCIPMAGVTAAGAAVRQPALRKCQLHAAPANLRADTAAGRPQQRWPSTVLNLAGNHSMFRQYSVPATAAAPAACRRLDLGECRVSKLMLAVAAAFSRMPAL